MPHKKNNKQKLYKNKKVCKNNREIVATLPGSRLGALYYRGLDKNKQYGLQKSKYNYEV